MIILFSKHFLGVSQSDFAFRKKLLITKTQKLDDSLNWQPAFLSVIYWNKC